MIENQKYVVTGNELAPNSSISLRTSAYIAGAGREEGTPSLQPEDTFDNNIYSSPFIGFLHANGKVSGGLDLTEWQTETAAAGNAFDINSQLVTAPTEAKVVILPNDYDPNQALVGNL